VAEPAISLQDWDDSGLALLEAMNTPEQKVHLGGPETAEKIRDRHSRYLTYHTPGDTEMMRIVLDGETVGSVGYWPVERNGEAAYEAGWEILSAHHGKGLGSAATRLLMERLKPLARHRYVFAYPTPANAGSNGICRRLGFELIATENAEYPKGVWEPHNIWRLDLRAWPPA
jgi:RimJ/RimL family protein N-acetyltransferase